MKSSCAIEQPTELAPFLHAAPFYLNAQLAEKLCLFRFDRHILKMGEVESVISKSKQKYFVVHNKI